MLSSSYARGFKGGLPLLRMRFRLAFYIVVAVCLDPGLQEPGISKRLSTLLVGIGVHSARSEQLLACLA
eukprot:2631470-Amphidinium_carterae.1